MHEGEDLERYRASMSDSLSRTLDFILYDLPDSYEDAGIDPESIIGWVILHMKLMY